MQIHQITGTIILKEDVRVLPSKTNNTSWSVQSILMVEDGGQNHEAFKLQAKNRNTSHLIHVDATDRVRVWFTLNGSVNKGFYHNNLYIQKVEKLDPLPYQAKNLKPDGHADDAQHEKPNYSHIP